MTSAAARDAAISAEMRGDDLEDAAAALLAAMREVRAQGRPSLDSRAVFLAMSRTLESIREVAAELAGQEWITLGDDPEADGRWNVELAHLDSASAFFEEVANGWI